MISGSNFFDALLPFIYFDVFVVGQMLVLFGCIIKGTFTNL